MTSLDYLRDHCQEYLAGDDFPIDNDVPRTLLRILDAFDAMERHDWILTRTESWSADQDPYEDRGESHWEVQKPGRNLVFETIAKGPTPLAALLAAVDKSKEQPND